MVLFYVLCLVLVLVLLTKFVFHTKEMKQLLIYNGITVLYLNFNLAVCE